MLVQFQLCPQLFYIFFWRFIIHYSAKRYGHTMVRFLLKRLVQHCGQILLKADWFSIVGRLLKMLVQFQLCPIVFIDLYKSKKTSISLKNFIKLLLRCDIYSHILFYIYCNIFPCIFYCIML